MLVVIAHRWNIDVRVSSQINFAIHGVPRNNGVKYENQLVCVNTFMHQTSVVIVANIVDTVLKQLGPQSLNLLIFR